MISIKNIKKICNEPVEMIENYLMAKNDESQYYSCHHRNEIRNILGITVHITKEELIGLGLYFHRPADELVFLPRTEHSKLHHKNPDFRKHISMTKKGRVSNRKGCHLTEEQKKRMSEGHKRNFNEVTRSRLQNAYKHHQDKILAGLRKPVIQIDINTGEQVGYFNSLKDANDYFGLPNKNSNIGACCRGNKKTAYGYKWKYAKRNQG